MCKADQNSQRNNRLRNEIMHPTITEFFFSVLTILSAFSKPESNTVESRNSANFGNPDFVRLFRAIARFCAILQVTF